MKGPNSKRARGHRGNGRRPGFHGRGSTFESNGPEGKIRGTAFQVIEKYQALARDALSAGDRIGAENFFQHAEHYYRVVAANGWDQRPPRTPAQPSGPQPREEQQPGEERVQPAINAERPSAGDDTPGSPAEHAPQAS